MTGPLRPERGVLLELAALLQKLQQLAAEGTRERYDAEERYRWVIHRLWIAVGNEVAQLGPSVAPNQPWNGLRKIRHELAHVRLSDIDEDKVWRLTSLRPAQLRQQVHGLWP